MRGCWQVRQAKQRVPDPKVGLRKLSPAVYRLAEAGASVAVLEAGYQIQKDDRVDIPANFQQTLGDEKLDWCLETVPQPGLDGRRVPLPRGKALGGTSMINTMTWARASKVNPLQRVATFHELTQ